MVRILLVTASIGLLLTAVAPPAVAQDRRSDRELVVLTGGATVSEDETVGDVVVFNGPVSIEGRVNGDVTAFNGRIEVSGIVDGDVVGFKGRAVISDGARVGGDVQSLSEPEVNSGARVGGDIGRVDFQGFDTAFDIEGARYAVWAAISVSALFLGLLIVLLFPRAADAVYTTGTTRTGGSAGWGLLLFFGIPVAAILLLITILGIPLGLAFLLALIPTYSIGYTLTTWFVGRRILAPPRSRALALLVGIVVLRLIALIPFVGGLLWFAATVFGLGMLFLAARKSSSRAEPAAMPG